MAEPHLISAPTPRGHTLTGAAHSPKLQVVPAIRKFLGTNVSGVMCLFRYSATPEFTLRK
jgi:hypothetical protein